MVIEYKHGDILQENAEALVNTVNCVGVMGRGIALQFSNAFPENFHAYANACKKDQVQPGKMFVFETHQLTNPKYIINFPTKRHWRGKSQLKDIDDGLLALVETVKNYEIKSIAIPPLGSGLGGLNWADVKPKIEGAFRNINDITVIIFEPIGSPSSENMAHSKSEPIMTTGRAALVQLIDNYLAGLLDPFVTLLEIHKLMYFLQEVGEPLRLKFTKAPYGPYAENLRHVLNAIEGYFIEGYADGGDKPKKQIKLLPGVKEEARKFLLDFPETTERLNNVTNFIEGFESPFGLELLSTVHWIMKKENIDSLDEVIRHTYKWNSHKRQFTERQIALAREVIINNNM